MPRLVCVGRGDERKVDAAAVQAMHRAIGDLPVGGKVVIGEGERDEVSMLLYWTGTRPGGPGVDIAADPLEGTTLCVNRSQARSAVVAVAEQGGLLHAPRISYY